MNTSFDLDAYFERIGYSGPRSATLDTLAALHALHPAAIAFENIDPLLRRPVRLDETTLQQKLVRDGRGGYCYEHNLLFRGALEMLGFPVTGLAARVMWNAPEHATRPRSHMLMRVDVAGVAYIADVGFGGLTLTAPLRFAPDVEQATPHELFRLTRSGSEFILQARVKEAWRSVYRFDQSEQLLPDYEVASWYNSTHPDSHFLSSLIAARAVSGARYALLNNELAVHHLNGVTERRVLQSTADILAALSQTFGITLRDLPELAPALQRFVVSSNEPVGR
jgi:N-hydroxyarylamine O-acetyltransferase